MSRVEEVGGWRWEAGGRRLEVGGWRLEADQTGEVEKNRKKKRPQQELKRVFSITHLRLIYTAIPRYSH